MRILHATALAAILTAGTTATGLAAVGSDQAREANSQNAAGTTATPAPAANQPGQTDQAHSSAAGQAPGSGKSVGPATGGDTANTPLGYAKGPHESSGVGKQQ